MEPLSTIAQQELPRGGAVLRDRLLKIAGAVALTFILLGCSQPQQNGSAALVPPPAPTPLVTPAVASGVPTPEVFLFDDHPVMSGFETLEERQEKVDKYCLEMAEFQNSVGVSVGPIVLSQNAASALTPEEVGGLNDVVAGFNRIAPQECALAEGDIIFALMSRSDDYEDPYSMAFVPNAMAECSYLPETVFLNPRKIRDYSSVSSVVRHELGHTCSNPDTTETQVIVNPTDVIFINTEGEVKISRPSMGDIALANLWIIERDESGSNKGIYAIMNEISADMFALAIQMNERPELESSKDFFELTDQGVELTYAFEVYTFYDSLIMNGYNIPPVDLQRIFVNNSNQDQPLLKIAEDIQVYKEPEIAPGVTVLDVMGSFAVSNPLFNELNNGLDNNAVVPQVQPITPEWTLVQDFFNKLLQNPQDTESNIPLLASN